VDTNGPQIGDCQPDVLERSSGCLSAYSSVGQPSTASVVCMPEPKLMKSRLIPVSGIGSVVEAEQIGCSVARYASRTRQATF